MDGMQQSGSRHGQFAFGRRPQLAVALDLLVEHHLVQHHRIHIILVQFLHRALHGLFLFFRLSVRVLAAARLPRRPTPRGLFP